MNEFAQTVGEAAGLLDSDLALARKFGLAGSDRDIVDRRARDRNLSDAAVLAACINDHAAEIDRLGGSDRRRLRLLAKALADPSHPAWLVLDRPFRITGQDTLRILTDETTIRVPGLPRSKTREMTEIPEVDCARP